MNTKHLPYELLAEQMAKEATSTIVGNLGSDNPRVIEANLEGFLKGVIHDSIETGIGLAGILSAEPGVGFSDTATAYLAGYELGKKDSQ